MAISIRVVGSASFFAVAFAAVLSSSLSACSSATKRSGFGTDQDPTEGTVGEGGTGGGFGQAEAGKGSICAINNTATDMDKDYDGDGFPLKYDCNECDTNINAGAFDVAGNGMDEDCNGTPDDEPVDCDDGLSIGATDAFDGAKAMGLCKKATDDRMWGVVSAKWVKPDGSNQSVAVGEGVLPKFGANAPQNGKTMLAISSGAARDPSQPGYQAPSGHDKKYSSGTPAGYPKESPSCSGSGGGGFGFASGSHDGAALQVKIRVPSNAKSFKYQQNFFTYEFPGFICDDYNDFYVAMMDPKPAGLVDGNIAFDQDSNPISVNNSLLQVCKPQQAGGKSFNCPLGNAGLSGTGFEDHAATGWLTTTAPVAGGKEITLTFAIWDQGDHILDSTALIDDFQWSVDAANGTQTLPSPPK